MTQTTIQETSKIHLIYAIPNQETKLLKLGLAFAMCFCIASVTGLLNSGIHIVLLSVLTISTLASGLLIHALRAEYRQRQQAGQPIFEQHQACVLGKDALIGKIITTPIPSKPSYTAAPTYRLQLRCIYEELSGELSDYDYQFGGLILWESEEIQHTSNNTAFSLPPPKQLPPSLQSKDQKKRNRWILTATLGKQSTHFEISVDTVIERQRQLQTLS